MGKTNKKNLLAGITALLLASLPGAAMPASQPAAENPSVQGQNASAELQAGADAIEQSRHDEAVRHFTRAINSGGLDGKGLALAYHHRGIAYQKLGQQGPAIEDYTAAIAQGTLAHDVLARTHYNRGIAYVETGKRKEAEDDYTKAIKLAPGYGAAYHNRANLERQRRDYPAAIRDYTAALEHMEGKARKLPLFGRAVTREATGDLPGAIADLKLALEADPSYAGARAKLNELAPHLAGWKPAAAPEPAPTPAPEPVRTAAALPPSPPAAVPPSPPAAVPAVSQEKPEKPAQEKNASVIKLASNGGWETTATRNDAAPARPAEPVKIVSAPPASIPPPVAPVAQAAKAGSYRLQLGAFRAPEAAARAWEALQSRHASLVSSLSHEVETADLGSRGTFYRLQAGAFESAAEARARCAALNARRIDCIVVAR